MPRLSIAVILLACCTGTANAWTPETDFQSDALLTEAVSEIHKLDSDQLESVIDWIASCNPTPAPERNYWCERAIDMADIKTSRAKALFRIRLALSVVDRLIPWKGRVHGNKTIIRRIDRRVRIFSALRMAAAARYQAL